MKVQRLEGTFREDFELDPGQIMSLAPAPTSDQQASQADQPMRKKPAWMKNTRTPEPAPQPPRHSGELNAFRFSAEKGAEGQGGGGGTPQLQTRMPGGAQPAGVGVQHHAAPSFAFNGHQQQQQHYAGQPLHQLNGQHHQGEWKPDWQQKPQQEPAYQHRYSAVVLVFS